MSKDYFEKVATQWDNMRQDFFSDSVRQKAYNYVDVKSNPLVVDVGAGTGFITEGMLQLGVNVIAVDQSPAMLEVLKTKFSNFTNLKCCLGDGESLPLANNTADYVTANMYIHHVESPSKAIKEMTRILKPGGRVIITDLDPHNFHFLKEEHHDRWLGFDHNEFRGFLKDGGLDQIQIFSLNENCCSDSCTDKERASIGIFLATGIKINILEVR